MQKRLFLRLALAALLSVGMYAVTAPPPAALAAAPTSLSMSGPSASAYYFGQDSGISWNISINLYTQTTRSGNTTTQSMRVDVFLSEFDQATGAGFSASTQCDQSGVCGVAAPEGAKINLPTSAYLPPIDVEVTPMGEMGQLGAPFTLHVGPVTWSGEGGVSSHFTSVARVPVSPTCDAIIHQIGRSANATAISAFSFTPPAMIGDFATIPVSVDGSATAFGYATLSYSGTTIKLFGVDCPSLF
ncbi:MAG TPA: hypothetical protein VE338_13660 [Ktedonobacterales bacterium]|jgi:hypothetical protein|nr:hypothetical protein [Ktedonobacterales bacterium]